MSTRKDSSERLALLQGTLDFLILRTPVFGRQHGQGIARVIKQQSDETLLVDHEFAVPGASAPRDARLNFRRVGYFGEQPQGTVLHADPEGPEAAPR